MNVADFHCVQKPSVVALHAPCRGSLRWFRHGRPTSGVGVGRVAGVVGGRRGQKGTGSKRKREVLRDDAGEFGVREVLGFVVVG